MPVCRSVNTCLIQNWQISFLLWNEYGIDQLPSSVNERNNKKKEYTKKQRKELLSQRLGEYRLPIRAYGDCFSFVEYGKPFIDEVVDNELTRADEYQKRRVELSKELNEREIIYDESYPDCLNYVKQRNHKTLHDTVRAIEIESFLRDNTNYLEIVPIYGKHKAQELALCQYYQQDDDIEPKILPNDEVI